MPLWRCLEEVPYREFLTWMAWLEMDMSRPGKAEHYAMQTSAEVRRGHAKSPRSVKLEQFKIPFRRRGDRPRPTSSEEATAWSKAKWAALIPPGSRIPDIPVASGDDIRLVEDGVRPDEKITRRRDGGRLMRKFR